MMLYFDFLRLVFFLSTFCSSVAYTQKKKHWTCSITLITSSLRYAKNLGPREKKKLNSSVCADEDVQMITHIHEKKKKKHQNINTVHGGCLSCLFDCIEDEERKKNERKICIFIFYSLRCSWKQLKKTSMLFSRTWFRQHRTTEL